MYRSMHLHTEIYPNLQSISELFKMYMKSLDSFILFSLQQPDTRLSPPLRRQSSFSSAALHQCLWDIAAAWLAVIFFLDIIGSQKHIATYTFHIK